MTLRGIRFQSVLQASGATNFDGRGWWYHRPLHPFGLDFTDTTFVSKTTTLLARPGNMPLKADGKTPQEWIPRCIIVNRKKKAVLNAVSLSGPGLEALIQSEMWQRKHQPFFISVMSLQPTPAGRRAELEGIFGRLAAAKKYEFFHAEWGIQGNFSCPNGGVKPDDLVDEIVPILEMADKILPDTIPFMVKVGPDCHPKSILRISTAPRCDALCAFNTLPFGKHPTWATEAPPIDWRGIFGTDDPKESPMARRFPGFAGGYSGAGLLPFLGEWLQKVRALGVSTTINAGGGILSGEDAEQVFDAGADSIFLGSIAMLAPTQVRKTIRAAQSYALR